MIMPTRLPDKPRAKIIRANEFHADGIGPRERRRELHPVESIDWLALWALSLGFSAVVHAALAFYGGHDSTGASMILFGTATIIALVLRFSTAPDDPS
jgi:hypothetical protein